MNQNHSSFLKRCAERIQESCAGFMKDRAKMLFKYSLLGAFIFGVAAHAFAYFNFAPLHDSLNYISHLAGSWEVSLGRFFQLAYGRLRGEYLMPWMSGMLSMLYIGFASFFMNDLFDVDRAEIAFLSAGFLSANATMTNLNMVFSYVTDVFALALLMAAIGAYLVIRLPGWAGVASGGVCFAISMGLYQSYVLFGGLLLVAYAMLKAVQEKQLIRQQGLVFIRSILVVPVTAMVYWLMYRYFMWSYGIGVATAEAYNSPARLASLDLASLLPLFCEAYDSFLEYFFGVGCGELNLIQKGTIAMCVLTGVLFVLHAVKENLPIWNILLIVLGVVCFPGAAQVISVLSGHGRIYFLTVHALYIMYPLLLGILQRIQVRMPRNKGKSIMDHSAFRICVLILCSVILFGNIRFSNEMYTYRAVQYDKTVSYVTRLMERIDSVPGYVRNETEVVFTGYISAKLSNIQEPDGIQWMDGMNSSAITYLMVLQSFAHMMGENMNILFDYSEMPDYGSMEEVKSMPAFPSPDCCMMIDGRVLVKLSDY